MREILTALSLAATFIGFKIVLDASTQTGPRVSHPRLKEISKNLYELVPA